MSDPNQRVTKAERKEQARREREQIRAQMQRRKRNRTIGTVLVALALAATVVGFLLLPGTDDGVDLPGPQALVDAAPDAAVAASCEEVRTVEPYGTDDQTHIGGAGFATLPDLSTYPSVPPTSGPHDGGGTLPAGIYDSPPPMGLLLHSLEHGGVVVWYDPGAPAAEIARIKDFYGQRIGDVAAGQDRVIVAPYDYPADDGAGSLPAGARMALVAWHRLQTCADVSLEVALDFTSRFGFPTALDREWEGEAPEAGAAM